ncbi:MAG: hypothetical protein FJ404_10920 [Verrucomicrobia bacterium]|nr:hypothetical protein [Verrucomicrobiota bacterium]
MKRPLILLGFLTGFLLKSFPAWAQLLPASSVIRYGETVEGKIALAGGLVGYSIKGTAGQRVFLDGLEPDNGGLTITVTAPSGKQVLNSVAGRDGGLQTLEETGNYLVTVDGIRESTGEFKFRILDVASGPELVSGKTVNGVLAPQRQSVVYFWKGLAGQRLKFDSGLLGVLWCRGPSVNFRLRISDRFRRSGAPHRRYLCLAGGRDGFREPRFLLSVRGDCGGGCQGAIDRIWADLGRFGYGRDESIYGPSRGGPVGLPG